ncbi:MAG: NgoFVII family restriction endonuclease [Clostridia bacterium]|nr:NgoFVII family restriction endonuclease [Clostridia bacterium]
MQYSDNIAKIILFEPIKLGCNRLCILSSNATPGMISWLFTTYAEQGITNISVELIIENVLDFGIDSTSHEAFKKLHENRCFNKQGRFSCSYLFQPPVIKKNLYIWLYNNIPLQAFNCSYNFTQTSLLRRCSNPISVVSPIYAHKIYEKAVCNSIFCNHSEVEDYVVVHKSNTSYKSTASTLSNSCVILSLVTKTEETGRRSGLNWGQRNKRNKNEAYIPLPSKISKSGFFPLNKQHFLVVTDDHHSLLLRVEQQNNKAITTPLSNAQLGEYFRNRLGLANGAHINAEDLKKYGRTDVCFYKIDDEQYYMDFSVNNLTKNIDMDL